jgi:uncharacterized membrane protein YfcA
VDPFQTTAAIGSGVIVGFRRPGRRGGSILAVPLLLAIVGMPDPHQPSGTRLAVAVHACANPLPRARSMSAGGRR